MVRASSWAYLKPGKGPSLAVLLATLAATVMGVEGAAMGPGIKTARELLAVETTIDASADQNNVSYGISVSSSSVSEVFEACSGEAGCSACLEIQPDINCKRDTIVNAAHCDDVAEVLCCAFYNDPDCMENETLLRAIEDLNENVCSLELPCLDGGIEKLSLGGDNAGLLVATGPDAVINPDTEQEAATSIVTGTVEPIVNAEDEDSGDTDDGSSEGGMAELTNGGATGMGVTAPTVAAVVAAAAFAGLTFLTW